MFKLGRQMVGRLVADLLTVSRGEAIQGPPPKVRPDHQLCQLCGFKRWDGQSEHPFAGERFARRRCLGPPVMPPLDLAVMLPTEDDLPGEGATRLHFRLIK